MARLKRAEHRGEQHLAGFPRLPRLQWSSQAALSATAVMSRYDTSNRMRAAQILHQQSINLHQSMPRKSSIVYALDECLNLSSSIRWSWRSEKMQKEPR